MKKVRISLVGAGSLGSYTVLALADMGYDDIEVYDKDLVEYHNRRNQLFREEDVGKSKVEALAELIKFLAGVEIIPRFMDADENTQFSGNVVIVLVDSMEIRSKIFRGLKYNPRVRLFIEARSGEHIARVYAVNPLDPDGVKRYDSGDILYSNEEAMIVACSNETTQPTVRAVAAVIAHFVRRWSEGWYPVCEEARIDFYDMPYIETEHLSI